MNTSKALKYGTRSQGISQFYLHTPRSSANGMNHTRFMPAQTKLVLIYRPQRDGRLSWPGRKLCNAYYIAKTPSCFSFLSITELRDHRAAFRRELVTLEAPEQSPTIFGSQNSVPPFSDPLLPPRTGCNSSGRNDTFVYDRYKDSSWLAALSTMAIDGTTKTPRWYRLDTICIHVHTPTPYLPPTAFSAA